MPDLPPDAGVVPELDSASGRGFATVRRGLDPAAVHRYLAELESKIQAMSSEKETLRARLEDAERRAAQPVLDEDTLAAAVGVETAKVLRVAHEAAREVVARAEARAAAMLAEASAVLGERTRDAEAEARAIVARSRAEASATAESAKAECRAMVEEAREARRRILADLADRRRALHVQLEQLRAGKDALAKVVDETARSVDAVRATLADSEADARLAADRAGELAALAHDDVSLDALVDEAITLLVTEAEQGLVPEEEQGPQAEPGGAADEGSVSGAAEELETDDAPTVADGPEPDATEPDATEPVELEEPEPDATEPVELEELEPDATEPVVEVPVVEAPSASPPSVTNPVDDLFARLRAGHAADPSGQGRRQGAEDGARGGEGSAQPHSGLREGSAALDESVDGLAPKEHLDRRDELLSPILAELARMLKRELRSDQNELLSSLRDLGRDGETTDLLPGDATVARLATATAPVLTAAWRAGAAFARPGRDDVTDVVDVAPARAAGELASEVVGTLRAQLDGALSTCTGDDGAAEAVGAAYRQWRGERVEDLAGDYATKVFALGVLSRVAPGGMVTWLADDGDVGCPDCDDNVIAGPQLPGTMFPTGQAHPPVHPGCRCILVPVGQ